MFRFVKILPLIYALIYCSAVFAANDDPLLDRELVNKALTVYQQTPLSEEGQSAGAILFMFASKSKEVKIALREELVPWIRTADPDDPVSQQLLVAYIAGNVKSQLEQGKPIDDPYSSIQMVLKIYALIKTKDPDMSIPELEQFAALQTKN